MDLNQAYFDHQVLLMKARAARSLDERRGHEAAASCIASDIGRVQRALGAPAAPAWQADTYTLPEASELAL